MKSLIVSFLCAGGAFAACGVQFFADAVNGNDDWDGTTAVHEEGTLNGPKRTLQAAVDLADGVTWTTITAAPGIYDQGEALVEGNATPNRLVIGKPYVTIEASGKKEETHIVGRKDASGAFGIGPNSVRCVYVMNLIDTARPDLKNQLKAVVLKGFTIRDGSSQLYGGGVFCEHKDNGGLTLVDCVVSNCAAARGGAAFRVAAFRTLFADNHSTAGESATAAAGGVVDFGTYESCIFANNHGSPVLNYPLQVVGCTFYGNECRVIGSFYDKGNKLYNCLSICNAGGNGGSTTYQNVPDAVNCVVAGNSYLTPDSTGSKSGADVREEQCVSTAFGDVRLFSDSDAIGAGDAQWQTKMTLPDGFAHTDFFGTSLPAGGAIDAGAVQSASEVRPTARLVRFKDAAFAFDGTLAGPETYFYESGSWPKVYDLGVRFGSGRRCFAVYIEGETYSSHPYYRPLDHSGRVSLVLPPAAAGSSADVVIRARAATGVAYANPDETKASDAYDGLAPVYDGTHGPKLTLQAAVNVITESYGLVLAASGVYDRGGATSPLARVGRRTGSMSARPSASSPRTVRARRR